MMGKIYYLNKEEFLQLANKGNLVPVYYKILADIETPISAFQKIGRDSFSCLLESGEGGDKLARYSFIVVDPFLIFQSKDTRIKIITKDKK